MGKKPNPLLAKYEAMCEERYLKRLAFANQMGLDAAMIAANEVLGLGPGRAEKFRIAYINAVNDMAQMIADDGKDDKELAYSITTIDRRIESIVGEDNFVPWEERYRQSRP